MDFLKDKKYESMDWLTQAIEPFESEFNRTLGILPNEVTLDFSIVSELLRERQYHEGSISPYDVIRKLSSLGIFPADMINGSHYHKFTECYDLEIKEDCYLDVKENFLIGTIKIIKVKKSLEEQELKGMLGQEGERHISDILYDRNVNFSRLNEILDLMGLQESISTRSVRRKVRALSAKYRLIMKDNLWNIKDVELSNKIGLWIGTYVKTGNLAALTNFCKLKVLTHNNTVIYSIEEELL